MREAGRICEREGGAVSYESISTLPSSTSLKVTQRRPEARKKVVSKQRDPTVNPRRLPDDQASNKNGNATERNEVGRRVLVASGKPGKEVD